MDDDTMVSHIEAILHENAVSLTGLEREQARAPDVLEDERYAAATRVARDLDAAKPRSRHGQGQPQFR